MQIELKTIKIRDLVDGYVDIPIPACAATTDG